ncbi:MAG TPA: AAA family ATPase [Streptosporangiaceae bacterium]|nr:AAA family ATPase [Streptosporangiaceae bacterium]
MTVLMVIGGLPATGKTTVASGLVRRTGHTYVRVDSIEQAIRRYGVVSGPEGYSVGYDVAADQLRFGHGVIVECVNPLAVTRDAWRGVAAAHVADLVEIEVICSDPAEHRRRAETRTPDIPGLRQPSWQDIVDREYEPWDREHLVIDTAVLTPGEAVAAIFEAIQHVPADRLGPSS